MNILVFHIDGKLMNLAVMRIVAHHREIGDRVEVRKLSELDELAPSAFADIEPRFDDPTWDLVYASILFERSRPIIPRLEQLYPGILVGGTGTYELGRTLADVGIQDGPIDYDAYPECTHSIGFAMRGCRYKCDFCVVPRKEGRPRFNNSIEEIWRWADPADPRRPKRHDRDVLLLDNDFFGNPRWKETIAAIRDGKFRVSIVQGFNVRILSDEQAEAVASINYRSMDFHERRLYMAWDSLADERHVFRGFDRLIKYGVKPDHLMVYMLIGYAPGETHADRDRRRQRLRDYGARPYPMPFRKTDELVGFARWVCGAYDKRIPWEKWQAAHYSPRRLGDRFTLPMFGESK